MAKKSVPARNRASDFFSVGSEHGSESESDREMKRKRDDSEEEEDDYNDEEIEMETKGAAKRRRDEDEDMDEDEYEEGEVDEDEDDEDQEKDEDEDQEADEAGDETDDTPRVKAISHEALEEKAKKIRKSGVVYISKIPPFMKPEKLRHIFSRFGTVERIFLAPEDSKKRAKRVKYGGNKKKNYTEGWAEFAKKRDAKLAADTLNGNKIGGKKNNFYYDDIMNVKYLHKFKWHNLTEKVALENQSRQEKMRAEIAQATRENKTFIQNVERSKMIEGIKQKRAERGNSNAATTADFRRAFDQRTVTSKVAGKDTTGASKDKTLNNVLSKVF